MLVLDLTGTLPENKITDELHTLTPIPDKKDRIICPKFGSLYVESLTVRDVVTGLPLIRNVDYITAHHDSVSSELTGKDIESLIIIINESISNNIKISYQALGGNYIIERDFLMEQLTGIDDAAIVYRFDEMVGTPDSYPGDENHPHEWWQVYGFDSLIENLDEVYSSIRDGTKGLKTSLFEYMELYKQIIIDANNNYESSKDHLSDYSNPHRTDKASIGLSEINNWQLAGRADSLNIDNETVYMGISGVSSLYNTYVYPALSGHITGFNNPHKVTAAQLGVYTKAEIDGQYANRLLRTSNAYDTKKFNGKTVSEFSNEVRTNFTANNVASNTTFKGNLIANNFDSSNTLSVLFGDGNLKPFDSVKPANIQTGWKWIHHRGVASSEMNAWMSVIGAAAGPGEKIFKSFWFTCNERHEAIKFLIGKREVNGTTTRII